MSNPKNAGRKGVPNGVRKTYIIPKGNVKSVNDIVKSYQDAAILKESLKNKSK